MKWLVDLGDRSVVWSDAKLHRYYVKEINKSEYADFEDWLADMNRMALVIAVIR